MADFSAKFATAKSEFEQMAGNYFGRPSTAIQRFVEKLTSLRSKPYSSSPPEPYTDSIVELEQKHTGSAEQLAKQIKNLLKHRKKYKEMQKTVAMDAREWAADMDDPFCKALIEEFANLQLSENWFQASLLDKMENLLVILKEVSQRERSYQQSLKEKSKLAKAYRDAELTHGKNAHFSKKAYEKYEVLLSNSEVLKEHRKRAINKDLLSSIMSYICAIQHGANKLLGTSDDFVSTMNNADYELESSRNNANSKSPNSLKENNVIATATYHDKGSTSRVLQNVQSNAQCPNCEYSQNGNVSYACKYHSKEYPERRSPSPSAEKNDPVYPLNPNYGNPGMWGF